jgi:hypothetical protein
MSRAVQCIVVDGVLFSTWLQKPFAAHVSSCTYLQNPSPFHCVMQCCNTAGTHVPRQQQSEDVKALLRALLKLKAAARRERERDSLAAAAALEDAVAAIEKRRSIPRAAQATERVGL